VHLTQCFVFAGVKRKKHKEERLMRNLSFLKEEWAQVGKKSDIPCWMYAYNREFKGQQGGGTKIKTLGERTATTTTHH
jgi:hypothetical protein